MNESCGISTIFSFFRQKYIVSPPLHHLHIESWSGRLQHRNPFSYIFIQTPYVGEIPSYRYGQPSYRRRKNIDTLKKKYTKEKGAIYSRVVDRVVMTLWADAPPDEKRPIVIIIHPTYMDSIPQRWYSGGGFNFTHFLLLSLRHSYI